MGSPAGLLPPLLNNIGRILEEQATKNKQQVEASSRHIRLGFKSVSYLDNNKPEGVAPK